MWVICMFDLPTQTDEERQAYRLFRKRLLNDGFTMMQYSVYSRHCSSIENARSHMDRMSALVPDEGEVSFLLITGTISLLEPRLTEEKSVSRTPNKHLVNSNSFDLAGLIWLENQQDIPTRLYLTEKRPQSAAVV